MGRSRAAAAAGIVAVVTAALLSAPTAARAGGDVPVPVPEGWTVAATEHLADGLDRVHLVRPGQSVHVARLRAGAPLRLRTVLSGDAVAEAGPRLERTSSMCSRTGCLVAVNGDFAELGTDTPLGAAAAQGELLRSPNPSHHQLLVGTDGRLAAGGLEWRGTIVPTDLRPLAVDAVNRPRREDQLVLYTPAHGPTTGTNPHGVDVPYRIVQPGGPIRLGYTALVELGDPVAGGDVAIPRDGGVVSGHGRAAEALTGLLQRVADGTATRRVLVRIETGAAITDAVGGSPILLRAGRRWFADEATVFVRGRHPRTAVAWTPEGDVMLVAADGRRPGVAEGLSLAELTDLLVALGATDALNLDGGGSTTFVVRGEVVNAPSDRAVAGRRGPSVVQVPRPGDRVVGSVERPVVSALAIVPAGSRLVPNGSALDGDVVLLPAAPPLVATDPASSPEIALPALVSEADGGRRTTAAAAFAAVLLAAVAAVTARSRRRETSPAT